MALKKLGVKVIDFTGGEPLLHRELDQLLQLAKKYGFITTITTNCLLYPKWAERLKGKVDMLHFSLDAGTKEIHDKKRRVECFDFVMESIRIASELGERPDILFTVFDDNLGEIQKVYDEICLPNGLMLLLNPSFNYNAVEAGSAYSHETIAVLRKWGKKKSVYINEAFLYLRESGGNSIANPVCKAASTTIVISPENKLVLPCYHLGVKEFPINNELEALYNSKEVKGLIELEGRLPECEGCVINCYMQPSFAVELNRYWFKALPSTLKYNFEKGTWKKLIC